MARITDDRQAETMTVYAVCLNSASERPDVWIDELAPGEPYSLATGAHGTLSAVFDCPKEAGQHASELRRDW